MVVNGVIIDQSAVTMKEIADLIGLKRTMQVQSLFLEHLAC